MIELEEGGWAEVREGQIFLSLPENSELELEWLTKTDLENMLKLLEQKL